MADDRDQSKAAPEVTWPGAPQSLIAVWNQRRRPLRLGAEEALPPPDCDLAALRAARVGPVAPLPAKASSHAVKAHEIRQELEGFSELAALNALLIAHLRKRRPPKAATTLFQRIWAEEGPALIAELPARWLISSAITFGDHGVNEAQRRIGLAMNMLFSLMKLYEYERLSSGQPAEAPVPVQRRGQSSLPLDMPGFSLMTGGLDINLMAQIWQMAGQDPVAGPLAHHLMTLLNHEPRGLFRRLNLIRETQIAAREAKADRRIARRAARDTKTTVSGGNTLPDGPKTAGT